MRSRGVAAAACLLLAAGGCRGGGDAEGFPSRSPAASPTSSNTLVVALVGTFSGPGAWRGDSAFRGADLGVHELNQARGDDDPVVELVTLDDAGDARTATELVIDQAASTRTIGIVYAGPPEGLPPAEDALAAAGIPALLCFGDLYGARLLSEHVFQVSPSYVWEARRIVRYLLQDRRYRTIGAITTDSFSGEVARRALTEALAEVGSKLSISELHPPEGGSYERLLGRLKRKQVEAVVVDAPPPLGVATLDALEEMGASYRNTAAARIASARRNGNGNGNGKARAGARARAWRPQVVGFDGLFAPFPEDSVPPPGTAVAASYARGAHYLPVPSFRSFRQAYLDWWESEPLEWERPAYEAVQMIGWARNNTAGRGDSAATLETLRGLRFGGLDVTFGPEDHASIDEAAVGLWVVPRPGAAPEAAQLPRELPWVPLGRGFSRDGVTTAIAPEDWRFLFRGRPHAKSPPPPIARARFGVRSGRADPVH
ncbi:MAG: ABC transporter substrate-binding protein [Actinomycetota bacterium]|nr:ABC transporter substrate-binding protein [Actinomycetota bacterium]